MAEEQKANPPEAIETVEQAVHPKHYQDRILLTWHAPEFLNHPRGLWWWVVVSALTLAIVIYSVLTNSATTAIVFLLLAGVYFLTHSQSPRIIDITVTELGIWVHRTFYPYNTIQGFWLVYNPPFVTTLNLQTTKKSFSHLVLQLNEQDPVEVQAVLSRKIPEIEGVGETFFELAARLFRL